MLLHIELVLLYVEDAYWLNCHKLDLEHWGKIKLKNTENKHKNNTAKSIYLSWVSITYLE